MKTIIKISLVILIAGMFGAAYRKAGGLTVEVIKAREMPVKVIATPAEETKQWTPVSNLKD